jgi:hydroxymethylpyrimidine pyrophosphatase-like HAD family hydrolase
MDTGTPVRRDARIRLLVADVDGTLTNSRHEVVELTCRVVDRIRAAGVRVMLATGRRYRDALPVQERLGIDDAPLVTASGALVKRPVDHATLWRAAFAPGVLGGVLRRIVAAGHEPVVYTDSFAAGRDFHCRTLAGAEPGGGGLPEYLHLNRHLADVRPDLDVAPPADAFAGFVMGSRDAMLALEAELAAAFPRALSIHVIKSPRYREWLCEIAPAGTTKWSGVAAVAASWGIAADEICAVGDDLNDLPMIRGAGLGVAMGNAADEVRAAADVVVGTHDGSGIADVAELILAGLAQPAPLGGTDSRTG